MITREEIMKELAAGRSLDEIVDSITATVNEANTAYKLQQEEEARKAEEARVAKKAAEAEAARIKDAKEKAVRIVMGGLADYLIACGKEDRAAECREVPTDEVVRTLDSMVELSDMVQRFDMLEFGKNKPTAKSKGGSALSGDKGIDDFLELLNLL